MGVQDKLASGITAWKNLPNQTVKKKLKLEAAVENIE